MPPAALLLLSPALNFVFCCKQTIEWSDRLRPLLPGVEHKQATKVALWQQKSLLHWRPTGIRDMETQGSESAAESAITMAMCMICQTQQQQLQAYAHHTQAILNMTGQQAEVRAHICDFMSWTGGDDRSTLPTPAGDAERTLTISIQKMAPGDNVEAFLQVFELTAKVCGWPPTQWVLCLLPLLTGDRLATANGLAAAARSPNLELRRALRSWLGHTEEGHQHRFRETDAGGGDPRGLCTGTTPINSGVGYVPPRSGN